MGDGHHETCGTDVVRSTAGVLYCFEASENEGGGGPSMYGRGITYDSGKYWWQGISTLKDTVIAVAARRFSSPLVSHVFTSFDGGRSFTLVGDGGCGVPVHQVALTRGAASGLHLAFRTAG